MGGGLGGLGKVKENENEEEIIDLNEPKLDDEGNVIEAKPKKKIGWGKSIIKLEPA